MDKKYFSIGLYSKNRRYFKAKLNPSPKLTKFFAPYVQSKQIENLFANNPYKYKSERARSYVLAGLSSQTRFTSTSTNLQKQIEALYVNRVVCEQRFGKSGTFVPSLQIYDLMPCKGNALYVRTLVNKSSYKSFCVQSSAFLAPQTKPSFVQTCICNTCSRSEVVSLCGNTVKSKDLQKDSLRRVQPAKRFGWNHSRYKLLFLWHGNPCSTPINFEPKRANNIRSGLSCIDNESKKTISPESTKKSILQIINQSREIINKKQLLVSVITLKFTHVLSPKKSPYTSYRFRLILPRGLQIYDWHHQIQIFDLYTVTYDFLQKNQRFCITKLSLFATLQKIFRTCPNKDKPRLVRACKARFTTKGYKYKCAQSSAFFAAQAKQSFVRKNFCLRTSVTRTNRMHRLQSEALYRQGSKKPDFFIFAGNTLLTVTSTNLLFASRFVCLLRSYVRNTFNKKHVRYARFFVRGGPYGSGFCFAKRALIHWRTRFRFCLAKIPQKNSNNIILSISGGQDSIFLLFCLSFLQSQIAFKQKIIWCNHFWQKSSFYTTLHLTKSAMAFSSPIMGFLPFHMATSPQLYQIVRYKAKLCMSLSLKEHQVKKNQNKISAICKSFFKKQSKQELSTKNVFYKAKTNLKKKKPKAYKKFIKEISETRARNWRHITIERACTFYGSTLCLNGHTLSDRVETILFNLIRGTKNKNFQTLPWKRRYSTFCYNRFYPTYEQVIKKTHIHFI